MECEAGSNKPNGAPALIRELIGALAAVLLAVLIGGCSFAPSPDVPRAKAHSPRFVSLNPCTDAILVEVADRSQILALSHYSRDPRASSIAPDIARKFAVTSGSVEEILALQPDVVVAGSFIAPAKRRALTRLGFGLVTYGVARSVAESEAQIRDLARRAGHRARGEALIARISGALAGAHRGDEPKVSAALWQEGQIVAGRQSLVNALLIGAGFSNQTVENGRKQGAYLSLEQVLADPPRVLLVAGDTMGQRHPVLDKVPNMRRARFDSSLLYCAGPTIIRAARRLSAIKQSIQ